MQLHLVDTDLNLTETFKKFFPSDVLITHDKFENIKEFDCLVSAANSFGIMDGGIDLAIRNYFGHQIQTRVQKIISAKYFGEQPIGTSFIVPTGNKDHPWLAHSPTMTVPMDISKTLNVYHAMLATLYAVKNHNNTWFKSRKIKTIVCCGLGTLTGRVPHDVAAQQMSCAYKNILLNETNPHRKAWSEF